MSGEATIDRQVLSLSPESKAATPIGVANTKIKPDVFIIQERANND
jgi:hypothetical protein